MEHYLKNGLEDHAAALDQKWHPLVCVGAGHSGGLRYNALLLYGGAVFEAKLVLFANGNVEMTGDTLVGEAVSALAER